MFEIFNEHNCFFYISIKMVAEDQTAAHTIKKKCNVCDDFRILRRKKVRAQSAGSEPAETFPCPLDGPELGS